MGTLADFLNSNFITSLLGAGAGASAGAYAAQRIADRSRLRERYLKEIRNTNAAISITFLMGNTLLGLKSQHVKRMKEAYDRQRADFEEFARRIAAGLIPRGDQFDIQADFETLETFMFPLDRLQSLAFDGLSLPTRPLTVTPMVVRAVEALNRSIGERNRLIEEFRQSGPHTPEQL